VIDAARDLLDHYWVLMPVKVLAILAIFLTFPLVVGYMEHKPTSGCSPSPRRSP
jgi:hypothetical protein